MVYRDEVTDANLQAGAPRTAFHVQRPLSEVLVAGYVLTEGDIIEIKESLSRRDAWIARYQKQESVLGDQVEAGRNFLQEVMQNLRLPITGYGLQEGNLQGLYHDPWVGPTLAFAIRPTRPVSRVTVHGWVPDDIPSDGRLTLKVSDRVVTQDLLPGRFSISREVSMGSDEVIPLTVEVTKWLTPKGLDRRMLGYILLNVELEHIL